MHLLEGLAHGQQPGGVGDLARLRTIGLTSWAPGARDHFIRISPVMLNGRHLRADSTQPVR